MTTDSSFRRRGRRVMVCVRGTCAPAEEGQQIEAHLQRLIEEYGLDEADHPQHVRCTVTSCLAVCQDGPIIMVHPDGIRYKNVDNAALERIFAEHFLQDQPVDELIFKGQPSRSVAEKRRAVQHRPRPQRGRREV